MLLIVVEATRQATQYTHLGIETALPIGSGHGPLNHVHSVTSHLVPPYVPPIFIEVYPVLIEMSVLQQVPLIHSFVCSFSPTQAYGKHTFSMNS